jgi:hypothetical protein
MSVVDYSELAARALKHKPVAVRSPGLSRDRGIAIVAQAIQQSTRVRRRARWWTGGTLTMAAAAAAIVVVPHLWQLSRRTTAVHAPSACSNAAQECIANAAVRVARADIGHMDGREIAPGAMMQADLGRPARIEFDSGTRMALEGNTMVAYDEGSDTHRFSLARGSVHLEVAKLKVGQRFLLNTVDAEVEVRGTVFDVVVLDAVGGCEQRTRVSVQEGVVEVRSAAELVTLHGGDVWAGQCTKAGKPPESDSTKVVASRQWAKSEPSGNRGDSASVAAVEPALQARAAAGQAASPGNLPLEALHTSDLAQQNDTYSRASAERNSGHVREALALYNQLIARYPGSALVESALVQRFRILKQTSHAEAVREAKQYVVRYPKGFARAEAEALVNSP